MKNENNEIDAMVDEFLAGNDVDGEQTMIDFSSLAMMSPKETAISTLFDGNNSLDLEAINQDMRASNYDFSSPSSEAEILTEEALLSAEEKEAEEMKLQQERERQEKKETLEYEKFDEEINYRKKLEKIMQRSTPTEPFAMNVVSEENITLSKTLDAPLDIDVPQSGEFEYYSHNQMGKFDKISVRTYGTDIKSSSYSPYLLKNKLIFATMLIIFAIYALEIGIFFLFLRETIEMNYRYYLILLFIAMIPLGVGIYKYSANPGLKVKSKINFLNMALNSAIVFVLFVVIVLIATLLTQTSFLDIADLLPKIIIPIVTALNYPIGILVYYLLYRSEKFFE